MRTIQKLLECVEFLDNNRLHRTMTRKHLERELKQIESIYEMQPPHLFAMWVLCKLHYKSSFAKSTLEEIYKNSCLLLKEGGPGDKKLDGFFIDNDLSNVYLYQVKWKENPDGLSEEDEATEVATALSLMVSDIEQDQVETQPDSRKSALIALRDGIGTDDCTIHLRAVTSGKWRRDYSDDIICLADRAIKDRISAKCINVEEVIQLAESETKDLKDKKCELKLFNLSAGDNFNSPQVLTYPSVNDYRYGDGLTVNLSGLSLAKLANKYGERLFDKNVRTYKGITNSPNSKRVNDEIRHTLINEPESFWYGHNGITILCDGDVDIDKSTNAIKLLNPQIVNGCQTTSAIRECFGECQDGIEDFAVLARIVTLLGDDSCKSRAAEDIAQRTNRQNAIQDADLRSNDEIQREFENKLLNTNPSWFYERKRDSWKNLDKSKKEQFKPMNGVHRIIWRDKYQQAWRAYIGKPSQAVSNKNGVWERGNPLYDEVFESSRRAEDIILVHSLYEWFNEVFTSKKDSCLAFDIWHGLRNHQPSIQGAKTLMTAHSVAMYGELVSKAYTSHSNYPSDSIKIIIEKLDRGNFIQKNWVSSGNQCSWNTLGPAIKAIMHSWASHMVNLQNSDDESSLYKNLKRPGEQAFHELVEILTSLSEHPPIEMVTPN